MTCGRRTVLIVTSVLAFSSVDAVLARQQATAPAAVRIDSRAVAQGFSVVLVLADFQATTVQDDVPPAARRALADMKDFLPYKSYKLLDAAWILGQGSSGTVTRLRGPEEQEYELRMHTSPVRAHGEMPPGSGSQRSSNNTAVSVRFTLTEGSNRESAEVFEALVAEQAKASTESVRLSQQEVARVQKELEDAQKRRSVGTADAAAVRDLERRLFEARDRLARAKARTPRATRPTTKVTSHRSGPVMDTSFTMELGETVVVGTSRLKGNSRALIALLTAVPGKSSTR
jgi:hypothetical protein